MKKYDLKLQRRWKSFRLSPITMEFLEILQKHTGLNQTRILERSLWEFFLIALERKETFLFSTEEEREKFYGEQFREIINPFFDVESGKEFFRKMGLPIWTEKMQRKANREKRRLEKKKIPPIKG
jgi:hypothetical protein